MNKINKRGPKLGAGVFSEWIVKLQNGLRKHRLYRLKKCCIQTKQGAL